MNIEKIELPKITTDPKVKQKEIIVKVNEIISILNSFKEKVTDWDEADGLWEHYKAGGGK